jgi:Xylose isomerase-like TIM barrel
MYRRHFIKTLSTAAAGAAVAPWLSSCQSTPAAAKEKPMFFKISLAEWSLHNTIRSGKMTNLDFPGVAKKEFGIDAVEYVNQFFMDKAKDMTYLKDLKMRCDDIGVKSVLIMCDAEGELGDVDATRRNQAVENHKKWVEAAQFLGCHCIRVNALGEGTSEEVASAAVDGLINLSEFAKPFGIKIIVENHGGYTGRDGWLASVMQRVNRPECGILPDFGNFCAKWEGAPWETPCVEMSDRYVVTQQFMPYAVGVSAKSYDFDAEGNCIETDYRRMLKIVKDGGYTGHIGIEYEGTKMGEYEGIRATQALLKKVGAELG